MFEISGKIKLIEDTQSFDSGFTKREFVVTTGDSKWPQDIKFEVVKDKCSLLDNFSAGQDVTVNFDIRGNEYNGRYYVNLNAWKIQFAGGTGPQNQPHCDNQFGDAEESSDDDILTDIKVDTFEFGGAEESSDDIPF